MAEKETGFVEGGNTIFDVGLNCKTQQSKLTRFAGNVWSVRFSAEEELAKKLPPNFFYFFMEIEVKIEIEVTHQQAGQEAQRIGA